MQAREIVSVSWLAYWPWVGVCLCVSCLWLDTEQFSNFFLCSTKSLLSVSVFESEIRKPVVLSHTPRENPRYSFLHSISTTFQIQKSLSVSIRAPCFMVSAVGQWAYSPRPIRVTITACCYISTRTCPVWSAVSLFGLISTWKYSCVGHLYILACFCNITSVFRGTYFTFWVFLLVSSLVCWSLNI